MVSPTVRSRLWAASVAFGLGFVLANIGILVVAGRDRWAWLAVAIVLMVTGAVGVLVADTRRRLSLWAVVGYELLVAGTLLPVAALLGAASTGEDAEMRGLIPLDQDWSAFEDVLAAGPVRDAALTTVVGASLATLVAMVLAVPAALALVRPGTSGRRAVRGAFVAVLLTPGVVLAVGWFDTYAAARLLGSPWASVVPLLAIALPLAVWLCLHPLRRAPWHLDDAVRADGATRAQRVRRFAVPVLGPDLLVVAALVWVVTAQDLVLGATLGLTEQTRPLSATLLTVPEPQVAATGLLWLIPALVLAVAFPRRVSRLIGRDPSP